MRIIVVFVFIFQSLYSFSQSTGDTSRLSVAISSVFIPKNTIYPAGCFAIGPCLFLNDDKLRIQLGFLYDFKAYYVYRESALRVYTKERVPHFILPLLFHYEYFRASNLTLQLSMGVFLDKRPGIIENNFFLDPILGSGIEYNLAKNLSCKSTVSASYSKQVVFPTFLLDFIYSFNKPGESIH